MGYNKVMRKTLLTLLLITLLAPLSLSAQSVDLLWQGETYTPPFYGGKSLWSKQSRVHVTALPQGLGSRSNLNYRWSKNGTILGNISGVGVNSIYFTDSILSKPQVIKVEIVSGSRVRAESSVLITPVAPTLSVYENHPLYGFMFHKEVGSAFDLQSREVTLTTFPLFFSTQSRSDKSIQYGWSSNESGGESSNSITFRTPDNVSGTSRVSAEATHMDKISQSSDKTFLIEFGNE